MNARRLTRRSLLAAGAASAAGGLVRPGGALAALAGPPKPVLEDRWIGTLAVGVVTIELSRSADLVGLQWLAPAGAPVELRFRTASGSWSGWVAAGQQAHGPDVPVRTSRIVGEPVWTGGTTAVQLRPGRALTGVRLHLVDVGVGARLHGSSLAAIAAGRARIAATGFAAALPLAAPVLGAGPGQPPIIARRAWAEGMSHPRVAPEYGTVQMAFVHHTDNPNGYAPGEVPAMLRAIFVFHRYVNGWNDIGYNFAIDAYGRIFEARAGGIDEPVIGAHAGGYNYVSTGVAMLGTYTFERVSPAAYAALERLLAWKLALHGVPAQGRVTVRVDSAGAVYSRFPAYARVSLPRIAGHRDADTTECPGDALYSELPALRGRVERLDPNPVRLTLALAALPASTEPATPQEPTPESATPPSATPAPTAPAPATPAPAVPAPAVPSESGSPATAPVGLAGVLEFLDGTPIAGAPITVQVRKVARRGEVVSERTIAEAVTDAQGSWSMPLSSSLLPSGKHARLPLRALYAGSGAPAPGTGPAATGPTPAPATTGPAATVPAGVGAVVSDPLNVTAALLSAAGSTAPAGVPIEPVGQPPST